MVDAIILAGGLGTRLREVVPNVPKSLAPINGVAFLDLLLEQIEQSGVVRKIVLAVGYKAHLVSDHLAKRGCKVPVDFSFEETPLGTGGAVKKAISMTDTSEVFVFNGDSYLVFSLSDMVGQFREPVTMAYTYVEEAHNFGRLEIDSGGRITEFKEKEATGKPGFINGGIYLFARKIFGKEWPEAFSLEKDLFPALLSEGVFGFRTEGLFIDIGTPASFAEAQTILKAIN